MPEGMGARSGMGTSTKPLAQLPAPGFSLARVSAFFLAGVGAGLISPAMNCRPMRAPTNFFLQNFTCSQ